ncbi:MAG TPA: amino acid adenylation domain-containing protein [Polyangiales bacterium]|nr:amino acid adenylation domain-containing protein [Polyangiales bacterium]
MAPDSVTKPRREQTSYGLSPMQSGMLFQSLLAEGSAERSGYDVEQLHVVLPETLQREPFERAWTLFVRRHPALSASFRWEGLPAAEQRPIGDVRIPVVFVDWSGVSEAQREAQRREFFERDRRLGFDLRQAPLMRVHVFELGPQQTELVWTVHHILLDGRSFAPALLEVFAVYEALLRGEQPSAQTNARPYGDYIAWFEAQDWRASLPFFKTLLTGKHAPTPLPLAEPAARPLPRNGPSHGEVVRRLERAQAERLRAFAHEAGVGMGALVQTGFALVLSRLTGDEDVLFGVTRSLRRSGLGGEAEQMMGLFINTLPVRVRIDEQQSIRELLAVVREQGRALRQHDHTPLVEVQGQSDMPRGTALFDSLLMYDNQEINRTLRAGDARWNARHCTVHEQPGPPLTVIVVDDDILELRLVYDRRRFRDAVAQRIAEYLATAFSVLPETDRVGELDVVPAEERQRVLFAWNDTAREFPDQLRIHELFEQRVEQQPHAPAVEMDGKRLSYAELEQLANRIANAVRARGAQPGQYVGICLSRGTTLVAALLAASKASVPYVPLDPDYPRERIDFMLQDAKAPLVITEQRFADLFANPTLVVDAGDLDGASEARPQCVALPTDPCYAIYTSGSTGKPKGVVLTHRAVINTLDWVSRTFEVGPGDRLLFVTSPCFDLSVYDTFGALGAGATVVVASSERMRDPQVLVDAIVRERITIWDSAPAALQRLSAFFPESGGERLRLVMLSGDWIPLSLPDAVRTAFPRAQVKSLGGATEAAIWSNWFPVGALDPRWTSVPYGKPIQNAHYHVLDRRMRPTPLGVPGDLYIGGTCLAEGYLERPELTAERFVIDPFRPDGRLYMTGDLARYFDDGELEFLGRADFQVKIRGYRVELGEIEVALNQLPGVREALCSAYTDASGQKALVAYVVAKAGATLDEEDIKKRTRALLPDFMVPSQVMILPAMPLSANGKVDRKALPSPTQRAASSNYVAPRTASESKMAEIWQQVLQRKRVGVTDNFFALGGQSLLAVMLVSQVEKEFGIRIPLSRVLEKPTIEELVGSLGQSSTVGRHLVTLNAGGTRPPVVLISGIGGFGFIFQGLAGKLGSDQPVHVLHAVGAEDEFEGTDHSIEEVASIYEAQVSAVCPSGPIVLGGYSFGILVALELALRLERSGRDVPLLVSFDGFAPGFPRILPMRDRALAHVQQFKRRGPRARIEYLRERWTKLKERLEGKVEGMFTPPEVLDEATDKRLRDVASGLWAARDRYTPSALARSDVLLLKASVPFDWSGSWTDRLYGWRGFVRGRIECTTIPGAHLQLFRAENDVLMARALKIKLDEIAEQYAASARERAADRTSSPGRIPAAP